MAVVPDRGSARGRIAWRREVVALATSIAMVAVVTAAIEGIKIYVPAISLGVLYVAAVLPVAVLWGARYAVAVAIGSMLAFNFFHLPPLHSFTLTNSENWFALGIYLVTAVVVSELAARSRRRAHEAEQREREAGLLAALSTSLLRDGRLHEEFVAADRDIAAILGASSARLELGKPPAALQSEAPHPLVAGGGQVGTLYLPAGEAVNHVTIARFLPALASLLAVASDRERLAREALDAETLRRSDSVKTAIIQAVSHDLRTPLATIEAAFGGLESRSLHLDEADRAELFETIRLELARLERLIDNLLDLSRLQAGAAIPAPELWPADQLLAQAFDETRGSERVEVQLPDDLPLVSVDAIQVQRILVNLLDNALRYSPPDEPVQVRVTATRKELVFRVVDHGPGIDERELERIFEPFHRAPGAISWRRAGLGLAIARGFAEANGGRVWAESRPGQGATLALALPIAATPVETTA